jgi:release factor glutamine methyltransferase
VTAARALLAQATDRLAAAGVPSPRVDAELLLAHVLGRSRSALVVIDDVDADTDSRFQSLVGRRAAREPLQHLTGTAPFRHLLLRVGPGVFVPRPETELLIDAVLPHLLGRPHALAVDLCSGSGALALAIADEAAGTRVVAVEQPGPALAWLAGNAAGTGVEVVAADVTKPGLLAQLRGQVDVVVSNPPYVPSATVVDAEVRADPGDAVFAGPDGLALMPAVLARAGELLRPGGVLALEHDDSHGPTVPALLSADGRWRAIEGHRDLAGRPRYATAVRASDAQVCI